MPRGLPLLLVAAVALGACKPAAQSPQAAPSASPSAIPVVFEKGWPEFWRDPANAVDVLNRTGARLSAYEAKGGRHQAEAVPTALDFKPTDKPNTVYITLSGTAIQVEELRYRLDLPQADQAARAAKSLGEMIVNSFRVLGLAGAREVAAALEAGKDAAGTIDGAAYRVAREAGTGTPRIIVTFSRTGASAPANS